MNTKIKHLFIGVLTIAPLIIMGNTVGRATARVSDTTSTTSTVVATTTSTTSTTTTSVAVAPPPVPTTTTTTLVPDLNDSAAVDAARSKWGACGEWHDLAISVGWAEADWPMLSKVIFRESTCRPHAWNKADPVDGSMGLTQINTYWCWPTKYNPDGWLQKQGALAECPELFDPSTNLASALLIFKRSGWGPWGF